MCIRDSPATAHQFHPQCFTADVLHDARHLDAAEVGIHLSRPGGKGARLDRPQRLFENSPEREAVTPFGRWRGIQAHQMALSAIAHDPVDLRQRQWRRGMQLVGPAHGATTDHELGLREKPIRRSAVAGVLAAPDLQPADKDFSGGTAPDVEIGLVDIKLLKAQPPEPVSYTHLRAHETDSYLVC